MSVQGKLALGVPPGDYVFVFSHGRAIGAVLVGSCPAKRRIPPLVFSGDKSDFEILRPSVVERLYGSGELQRLIQKFRLQDCLGNAT
jgi:hypothetical protein